MGKWRNTISLMGASWQVLKNDWQLLIFPLISGICCLVVLSSFAVPFLLSGQWGPPGKGAPWEAQVHYYVPLFLLYFCNYLVIIFFNSAIVACAAIRLQGGTPTAADGFRAAGDSLGFIVGWAFASSTVGLALRIMEDNSKTIGKIVAGLVGMAWSVTSFLVVPVLVLEKKGPIDAFKQSMELLKKTWGEQLIGNFRFGLIFFFLAILFVVLLIFAATVLPVWLVIAPAFICAVGLILVHSALYSIFQTALYLYARNNQAPPGFEPDMLRNAIAQR